MKPFLAVLWIFSTLLTFLPRPSLAQWDPQLPDPMSIRQVETIAPPQILSDGALRYRIDLRLPEYRDLTPAIALDYNSSRLSIGIPESWLGPGWAIAGLSSIERVRPGGGAASYDDAVDIFTLNGEPLIACAATPVPNYPSEYVATRPSASCTAGGDFVTFLDDYRRIEVTTASLSGGQVYSIFTVTDPDGTRHTFLPVGVIAGLNPTSMPDNQRAVAFERKFLLTETRDTQAISDQPTNFQNAVRYQYAVDALSRGLAHRLTRIDYGNGYNIILRYSDFIDEARPMATFSVGNLGNIATTLSFGRQFCRLENIQVYDGTTPIRAYRMTYEVSARTLRSRLTQVREFGSDFVVSGTTVTGTSYLPHQFTVNNDYPEINGVFYEDAGFHMDLMVADTNNDGFDEAIFQRFQRGSSSEILDEALYRFTRRQGTQPQGIVDETSGTIGTRLPGASINNTLFTENVGFFQTFDLGVDGIQTPDEFFVLSFKGHIASNSYVFHPG